VNHGPLDRQPTINIFVAVAARLWQWIHQKRAKLCQNFTLQPRTGT
jgi:hypothetical protein